MAALDSPRCGVEAGLRKFSVVFNPTVVVKCDGCRAFIRHLPALLEDEVPAKASMHPGLSSVVIVVRAQARVLHFFRGRRLSRVIEFSSPIVDVAGLPRGASHMTLRSPSRSSLLCVVICRDGTAYAVPTHEILGAAQGTREVVLAKDGLKRESSSILSGAALKKKNHPSCSSEQLGLFDDMAPTLMADDRLCPPPPPPPSQKQENQHGKPDGGGNSGSRSNRVGSLGAQGSLVMSAQEQWAIFGHLGARVIAVCDVGNAVAVAGIIDRASLYGLPGDSGESGEHAGRRLGTLCAVDGASPTSSCVVWMGNGVNGEDSPSVGYSAWSDVKGFSLDPRVFRALFGPELALLGAGALALQPSRSMHLPSKPAVVLVGDEAGVVRWSPVPPHPLVPGGVLATLSKAIVGMLPRLEGGCHESIGFLIVTADGTVLSIAAIGPARVVTRERERHSDESGSRGDGSEAGADQQGTNRNDVEPRNATDLPSICTRILKVPFPIASPCSVPGFLVHCHAGALFASALPALDGTDGKGGGIGSSREAGGILSFRRFAANELPSVTKRSAGTLDVFGFQRVPLPLRPVRLPLPCEITAAAVAPVLSEVGAGKAVNCDAIASQTLIVCLSVRGKLLGFMAPRSADELDGWGLDSGKGGVRVGGSAGVERRVRCQLERLSSVGRQCAMLSAESAKRDREIRTLRGATGLLPTLVADAARRSVHGKILKGPQSVGSSALEHSLSMVADAAENASYDSVCGMMGYAEALRVHLYIRLWVKEGNRARELPNAGEDGPGRWSIVTRVMGETRGYGDGKAAVEGWSWSTSAPMPMATLRQGSPWTSSVALCLPSAEPITVSSWLQYRFRNKSGDSENGEICHVMDPGGCCVELGSSRFDILDWGVALRSIPSSTAAVREAALGRGACFCGPELSITKILGRPLSVTSGSGAGRFEPSPASRTALPTDWGSFRLRVASHDCDANILLSLLLPSSKATDTTSANNGGAFAGTRIAPAEYALRVAGQVVVVRAEDLSVAREAMGNGRDRGKVTISRDVEIVVMCSHEAMAPVVREALLYRARTLPLLLDLKWDCSFSRGSGSTRTDEPDEGALMARADAAARLVREVHLVGQAVANTSASARALAVERAKDGPSSETASKALVLMSRVAGIYQELRRQQEVVGAAL